MTGRGRKLAGPVLYWVVARNEDTTELLDQHSCKTQKEAEEYKVGYEEQAAPPECTVKIEPIPVHMFPPRFLVVPK